MVHISQYVQSVAGGERAKHMTAKRPEGMIRLDSGTPSFPTPEHICQAAKDALDEGLTFYAPGYGDPEFLAGACEAIRRESGGEYLPEDVFATNGASSGIYTVMTAFLDPGDEVIIFTPYFVEYLFYADNHGGKAVPVSTGDDFRLDFSALKNALNEKTKAVIINSPNNPTGVVYSRKELRDLADILKTHSNRFGKAVHLISDDPYKKITFDGVEAPNILEFYDNSIYITSHSKDIALPGERIGFVAVHPRCEDAGPIMAGLIFCNRVLGFVNAPALIQRVVKQVQSVTVDVEQYRRKRDYLYKELTRIGYDVVKPQGAFYFFPKSPLEDEVEFVRKLAENKVLVVPGRGFGLPGYFRISYCFPDSVIEGSILGFEQAFRAF